MNQVHIIRTTDIHRGTPMWIAVNEKHRLNGRARESRSQLLRRWQELHGKIDRLIEYDGSMRPSEAAMTIVSIQEGTA